MIYEGTSNEYLELSNLQTSDNLLSKKKVDSPLTFIWFEKDDNNLIIDNIDYNFNKNQIVCLTEFHQVDISHICDAKMIRFNRQFYCIIDHDSEVGCKGILFFGASQLPIINVPDAELVKFLTIWKMFEIEMASKDDHQLEMLQSMLKRFIIMCTRLFKSQNNYNKIKENQINIVKEYNFLVEQNFKTVHTVTEYASMLNKSPKTLSNLFSKISSKTPLQFIQDRKILEAKRLLRHTDMSITEISFEIGFEDLQTFGRFFKNHEGISPTDYKENKL